MFHDQCLYIIVLYIDPNDQCVLPVYFWSRHQPIRSFLLHHSYNIMFYNNTIYYIKIASNKLKRYSIFQIKFPMKKIYCFSVIISLFLSHNKLYLNDLIYCFNINSCIFLFSTMSKKVCLFSLYIFVLTKTYQIVFIISE